MIQEQPNIFSRPIVVYSIAILCTLLWGSSYPAIKTGYSLLHIEANDIPSQMVFAGQRFTIAGLILIILSIIFKRRFGRISKTKIHQIITLGLTQTTLQYIFFYIGVAFASGVKASIMNSTGTFFSVLLAHFIYNNDRLTHRKSLGVIIGFIGVFTVNFNPTLLNFDFTILGEGSVMFAAFILAASSIYGKRISQGFDAMVMTAWQLTVGGVALLCIGITFGGHSGNYNLDSGILLLYLAILSSAAFALWSVLLKHNTVSKITIFNFLVPIFGSSLSSLFLDETILEVKNIFALILVCTGIYLVTQNRKPKV